MAQSAVPERGTVTPAITARATMPAARMGRLALASRHAILGRCFAVMDVCQSELSAVRLGTVTPERRASPTATAALGGAVGVVAQGVAMLAMLRAAAAVCLPEMSAAVQAAIVTPAKRVWPTANAAPVLAAEVAAVVLAAILGRLSVVVDVCRLAPFAAVQVVTATPDRLVSRTANAEQEEVVAAAAAAVGRGQRLPVLPQHLPQHLLRLVARVMRLRPQAKMTRLRPLQVKMRLLLRTISLPRP